MFTRTDSGISNLPRFHRVDKIVYVEGRGGDERYWSVIFGSFGPKQAKIKFSSLGDCNAVDAMAAKICIGSIKESIAVLDADFKALLGTTRKHKNVIYSFGYSYENDLFTRDVSRSLVNTLSAGAASTQCLQEFDAMVDRGAFRLRRLVAIELMYFMNNLPLLFVRQKHTGGIAIDASACNPVQFQSVKSLIATARQRYADVQIRPTHACVRKVRSGNPLRWVFGHLVRQYAYHLIICTAASARNKKVTIDADTFESIAISVISGQPKLIDKKVAAIMKYPKA